MSPDDTAPADPHVLNEDRYAQIPEALLYDPAICAEAVRVYGVLRRHGDDPRNCYPGHARIAGFIGKSARSIPSWIRQLEAAGWIERHRRKTDAGDWDSNSYTVHGRAAKRGVRAGERRGSTPSAYQRSTPESAVKESNEREQLNDLDDDALQHANPNDLTAAQLQRLIELSDEEAPLRNFA